MSYILKCRSMQELSEEIVIFTNIVILQPGFYFFYYNRHNRYILDLMFWNLEMIFTLKQKKPQTYCCDSTHLFSVFRYTSRKIFGMCQFYSFWVTLTTATYQFSIQPISVEDSASCGRVGICRQTFRRTTDADW